MPRLRLLLVTALVIMTTLAAVPGVSLAQADAIPSPQAALERQRAEVRKGYDRQHGWGNRDRDDR